MVDLDSDDEAKNRSAKPSSNISASKNLKRKLDFDKNTDENEPPKKKVLWKNSISSDSASDKGKNNVHNVDDDSNNSDDEDVSGVNENYNNDDISDGESSEDNSGESGSPKWKTNNARSNTNNSTNTKKSQTNRNGYKLQTNEKPKQKSFQQRTDKSRLTHSAVITQMKQFPDGAQIKDIQGVSTWENQMIYFILM